MGLIHRKTIEIEVECSEAEAPFVADMLKNQLKIVGVFGVHQPGINQIVTVDPINVQRLIQQPQIEKPKLS